MLVQSSQVTLARKLRGLSQRELASRCDVTPQSISAIEHSKQSSRSLILKIATELRFPIGFFEADPVEAVDPRRLTFRAQRKMTSAVRGVGEASSELVLGLIGPHLEEEFILPSPLVPNLSDCSPEEAAEQLRSIWNLGYDPIPNMVHLLESKGVLVFWIKHESNSLDAYSVWEDSRPYCIGNTHKEAGERGRFDLAHELGHLVLHQDLGISEPADSRKIEAQANEFASAFLMPRETFGYEAPRTPNLHRFFRLKPRWKTSAQAMIMRASRLGLLSDWQKRSSFKQLNAGGWRTREPFQEQREQSRLHEKIFSTLAERGVYPSDLAATLNLNVSDVLVFMPAAATVIPDEKGRMRIKNDAYRPGTVIAESGHLRVIRGGKPN